MALAPLRKLKRTRPTQADFKHFFNVLKREKHDRVVAISASSFLDMCLKFVIWKALPNEAAAEKLFEDRNPLDSFSAKIAMAHALGLYGNLTRRNLDILREIRNLFAHDTGLFDFATPEIAEACAALTVPHTPEILRYPDTARDRYIFTAIQTARTLFMNSLGTFWEDEPEEIKPVVLP